MVKSKWSQRTVVQVTSGLGQLGKISRNEDEEGEGVVVRKEERGSSWMRKQCE